MYADNASEEAAVVENAINALKRAERLGNAFVVLLGDVMDVARDCAREGMVIRAALLAGACAKAAKTAGFDVTDNTKGEAKDDE